MASFAQFSKRMSQIALKLPRNVNEVVKAVAVVVGTEVVLATPVDEGDARSNWIAQLDTANSTIIEPHAPGKHLGLGERANANKAISSIINVVRSRRPHQLIHISNGVPYIIRLNDGYSPQAPSFFVQISVRKGLVKLSDLVRAGALLAN